MYKRSPAPPNGSDGTYILPECCLPGGSSNFLHSPSGVNSVEATASSSRVSMSQISLVPVLARLSTRLQVRRAISQVLRHQVSGENELPPQAANLSLDLLVLLVGDHGVGSDGEYVVAILQTEPLLELEQLPVWAGETAPGPLLCPSCASDLRS